MNVKVDMVGGLLHPSGKLGCAPDGVVGNIAIEIKCPETKIDKDILREIATGKLYVKYNTTHMYPELFTHGDINVYVFPNDDICLNVKHQQGQFYYHQVHGMMHLSGKKRCDVIVWTPKATVIFLCFG
ncbi:hypothetical protein JTE90_019942 [Oedothorax gibbosus]|uniref:YqaJ viral recombinase domain-containing protein n=1 Tax=Oedothorax gibbosus TaxID=931172 RepID=A0AAV6UQN6_9ARAC|nr:hypothetical protein JTE90_019942 [Oedothorax gibbosus]